jgi:hypothetical protein
MKLYRSLLPAALCCASLLALCAASGGAQDSPPKPIKKGDATNSDKPDKPEKPQKPGPKPPGEPAPKRPPSVPRGDADPFRDLTPDQRDRLREAVRRAWNDPAVIQARDEVKAATDAYQNALRDSLVRTDPAMAGLIEKFRLSSQSDFRGYLAPGTNNGRNQDGDPGPEVPNLPGSGGNNNRDGRGFEGFLTMENPAFLRELDDEKKRIYREAHHQAMENSEVRTRMEALKSLRHEDDEMRRKRTEAIRGVHQSLRKALVEADPRVGEFLPKAPLEGRRPDGENPEKRGGKSDGEPLPLPPSPPRKPGPEPEPEPGN